MTRKSIDRKTERLLWGRAAGCCEICSKPIYEDELLRHEGNQSNLAHINAASEKGPRYDPNQTEEERHSIDNLMLLCLSCHNLIDENPDDFTAEKLREKSGSGRAR